MKNSVIKILFSYWMFILAAVLVEHFVLKGVWEQGKWEIIIFILVVSAGFVLWELLLHWLGKRGEKKRQEQQVHKAHTAGSGSKKKKKK